MQIKFSDAHMAAQVFCNAILDNRAMGVEGSNLGLLKKTHKLAGMTVEQKEVAVASMILKMRSNANPMNIWFLRRADNTEVTPQALEDIKTNDVNLFNELMQTLSNDVPKEERLKMALSIFTKGFVFFKNQAELNVAFEEAQEAFTAMHPTEAQVRCANEFWKQLVGSAERFATNELYYPTWDGPVENQTERFGMIDNTFDQVLNQVKGANERFMADQERLARAQSVVSRGPSRNLAPAARVVVDSMGELVQHAAHELTPEPELEPIAEEEQEQEPAPISRPVTPEQPKPYRAEWSLHRYHGASFGIEYHHTTKVAPREYETIINANIEQTDNPVEMNVPEISNSPTDLRNFATNLNARAYQERLAQELERTVRSRAAMPTIAEEPELNDEELLNSLQNADGGESLDRSSDSDGPPSYDELMSSSASELAALANTSDDEAAEPAPTLPSIPPARLARVQTAPAAIAAPVATPTALAKVEVRPSSVMTVIGQVGTVAAFRSMNDAVAPLAIPATPKPAVQSAQSAAEPTAELDSEDDEEKEDLGTNEIPYWVQASEHAIAVRGKPLPAIPVVPVPALPVVPPPPPLPPLRNIGATGRVTSSRINAMQDVAEIKRAQQVRSLSPVEEVKRVKLSAPRVFRVRMAGEQ